jgi:hypothetical protein
LSPHAKCGFSGFAPTIFHAPSLLLNGLFTNPPSSYYPDSVISNGKVALLAVINSESFAKSNSSTSFFHESVLASF